MESITRQCHQWTMDMCSYKHCCLDNLLTYLLISGRIKPVTSALQGGYSTQFTPVSHNHQLNNYSIKNTIINNIHYCLFNRKLNRWKH